MQIAPLYLRGVAIGFAIAAAIGPVGLLCIRRTLAEGRAIGLATGLGAATADALYGAVAAFGLSTIADVLVAQRRPVGILGGALLVLLAVRGWSARRGALETRGGLVTRGASETRGALETSPDAHATLVGAYATTLAITIANPATILSFAAAFAGFGLVAHGGPGAVSLVAGVFSGSLAWWLALVTTTGALRPRLGPVALVRLTTASAMLIGAMGALAIWSGLHAS
jgi:threonine/homoserine/homoserine lactone efflux protein